MLSICTSTDLFRLPSYVTGGTDATTRKQLDPVGSHSWAETSWAWSLPGAATAHGDGRCHASTRFCRWPTQPITGLSVAANILTIDERERDSRYSTAAAAKTSVVDKMPSHCFISYVCSSKGSSLQCTRFNKNTRTRASFCPGSGEPAVALGSSLDGYGDY